jgi:hypothetical protein
MSMKLFDIKVFKGIPKMTLTCMGASKNDESTSCYHLKSAVADTRLFDLQMNDASTSGDSRVIYARKLNSAINAAGGEAIRAYLLVSAATGGAHGIHATAEVTTGGSVSGEIAGVRATIATAASLTLASGHLLSLRLDSALETAVTGVTKNAFIGCYDVGTYHVLNFLYIDASASGVTTGTTASTAAGCLKVMHNGTQKYVQLFSTAT